MSIKNGDLPAMPIELNGFGLYEPAAYTGLTKREQFAMAAMQGILACDNSEFTHIAAQRAVEFANALLAELERTK